uniref:F-box domain-containing protein n=1 Tax=Leersia perrieri TaxID=77586 RepID=A0A0D9XHR1_9ORYZ
MDAPPPPPSHRRRDDAGEEPSPVSVLPEEVLVEILHLLPPSPCSLPHLSLVCKRWRRLVSDPAFHRRFHSPHRRRPPLLGFFHNSFNVPCFVPIGDPPDRVPAEAFSLRRHPGRWLFLGCRGGRALLASPFSAWRHLMVWDPLSGDHHEIPVPRAFHQRYFRGAALLCSGAGECCNRPTPSLVAFAFIDQRLRPSACIYSSESGEWGEVVYGKAAMPGDLTFILDWYFRHIDETISVKRISAIDMKPPVLVGDVVYWLLVRNHILEFNMDAEKLAVDVISGPDPMYFLSPDWSVQIMPAEGGTKLGFGAVRKLYLHLWVFENNSDNTTCWMISRIIPPDLFLPPELWPSEEDLGRGLKARFGLLGFNEDGNVAFMQTTIGVFMVQLDAMQFKLVLPSEKLHAVHPYSSFYLTEKPAPCFSLKPYFSSPSLIAQGVTMAYLLPEDVLIEIFLHLPKHPTCLLGASLVCKQWHCLITDQKFIQRFRAIHQTPPVLGIFTNSISIARFLPIGNSPECVTAGAFSLPDPYWQVLGCRRSRVLLASSSWTSLQVWNPMTGNRQAVPVTPDVNPRINYGRVPESHAAVLCAAGHNDHGDCGSCPFFIVWVFTNIGHAYISKYSSEKRTWELMASSPAPSEIDSRPGILVGNAMYWPLKSKHILAFELGTSRLYHIKCPSETHNVYRRNVHIMKAEDGGLGLADLTGFDLRLWAWEIHSENVTGWVLRRTIELGAVLPLEVPSLLSTGNHWARRPPIRILGLVEDDDLFFISSEIGVFAVQLKSLQFKKVFEADVSATIFPYTSFYTAEA